MRPAWLAFVLLSCSDPHAPPTVERLDCIGCHGSEFDAVAAHEAEGAGSSCWTCHGTTGWYPLVPTSGDGTRQHSWFRIARGDHAGWDCWQCHIDTTPDDPYDAPTEGDYSCIGCHDHTRGRTDPLHLGNDDYSWEPKSCRRCHRRGGGDD